MAVGDGVAGAALGESVIVDGVSVGTTASMVGVEVGKPKLGPNGARHLRKKSGYPKPKPRSNNMTKRTSADFLFKAFLSLKKGRYEYNT